MEGQLAPSPSAHTTSSAHQGKHAKCERFILTEVDAPVFLECVAEECAQRAVEEIAENFRRRASKRNQRRRNEPSTSRKERRAELADTESHPEEADDRVGLESRGQGLEETDEAH